MNQLFQSKSIVAKLLAAENIIVEHRKVPVYQVDCDVERLWQKLELEMD